MTDTTLRFGKQEVYGIAKALHPVLGFWWDDEHIECWGYDADGGFAGIVGSEEFPDGAAGPAAMYRQRFVHAGPNGGPLFLWTYSNEASFTTLSGTSKRFLMIWDLGALALRAIPVPQGGLDKLDLATPLGVVGSHIYFFADSNLVAGGTRTHLWRSPTDGSGAPEIVTTNWDNGLGNQAHREANVMSPDRAYVFAGLGSDVWDYPIPAGVAVKDPEVAQTLRIAASPSYYAGQDAEYEYWVGAQNSGDPPVTPNFGQVRLRRDKIADLFEKDFTFATEATAGSAHLTINADATVSGYYPFDGDGGNVLKLGQPRGDETVDGNDGADPQITLEPVGGNNPMAVHLNSLTHEWAP